MKDEMIVQFLWERKEGREILWNVSDGKLVAF